MAGMIRLEMHIQASLFDEMRVCTQCGEKKSLLDFSVDRGRATAACKMCRNEAQKARYVLRADEINAESRRRRLEDESIRVKDSERSKRYYQANKARTKETSRRWYEANRDRAKASKRNYYLRKVFGISAEAYEALLSSQGDACALCGTSEPGGSGSWHIDHDHRCCPGSDGSCGRCIRGLLCVGCNLNLGVVDRYAAQGRVIAIGDLAEYSDSSPWSRLLEAVGIGAAMLGRAA